MAGITQKSSVDAFLLWSLQKQNGWVKRNENNMKDIGISITCWRVQLRWETKKKTKKIRFFS